MSTPTAIVTGASSGIGEATARALHERGFVVHAAARRTERMSGLAELGVRVGSLDVTDDASMTAYVDGVLAQSGRIDVLVNNAGYGSYGAVEDVPLDEARRQVEVNLFGLARMVQLVTPHLRRQGSGRIVNVSSVGGRMSEPLGGWYHATKYAVEGLSDALWMELAPFGVQVVLVEPGAIRTEWGGIAGDTMRAASGSTAYADQARGLAAMHRAAFERTSVEPAVVAEAIVTASTARRPRARYVAPLNARVALGVLSRLPDRVADRVLTGAVRRAAREETVTTG